MDVDGTEANMVKAGEDKSVEQNRQALSWETDEEANPLWAYPRRQRLPHLRSTNAVTV